MIIGRPDSAFVGIEVHGVDILLPLEVMGEGEELVRVQEGSLEKLSPVDGQSGTGQLHEVVHLVVQETQLLHTQLTHHQSEVTALHLLQFFLHSLQNVLAPLPSQDAHHDADPSFSLAGLHGSCPILNHQGLVIGFLGEGLVVRVVLEELQGRVGDHGGLHVEPAVTDEHN